MHFLEKLSIVPQSIKVIENICNKYASPNCKGDERVEAGKIVQIIQQLYRIEKEIREKNLSLDGDIEEIVRIRQEKAKPIFEDLKATLEQMAISISPDLELHKAIRYALKELSGIALYRTNAFVSIDNNLVENAIRPLAIGRKTGCFVVVLKEQTQVCFSILS